jgi:poly-gamma-glutamate capsule biosynthesis protein CapA/YwtB (metallophosphatase superfamily)
MTELLFTGDLFLGGDLHRKKARDVVRSIAFQTADKRIVNLEQPISDNNKVADKCTLYTSSCAVDQLNELKIDAVNLAHNHIQDKEDEGIIETIAFLSQSEIGHFGAGKNISEAQKPFWINDKLCVLGFCEFNRPYLKQTAGLTWQPPKVNSQAP